MSFQSSLSTEIDLLDDSDKEKAAKKNFLLSCVLVGEYLSEKKKGQHFTPGGLVNDSELCKMIQSFVTHFREL